MSSLAFVKAEANGNDFLLVEAAAVPPARRGALARALCDRHRGLGADGVEYIAWRAGAAGFDLALFNADGGEAEFSGNGTRCAAAWAAETRGWREMGIGTAAGEKQARVLGRAGAAWRVETRMGAPGAAREHELELLGRRLALAAFSMGNPQCCVLVEAFPDDWERLGAALESHALFPQRTNVEFVRPLDRHSIEIRIFERGVGVTQSSGTGSCAAAVTAIRAGRAASPVRVVAPGGEQEVEWAGGESEVRLRGPARIIASGTFRE
ncbi:MAG TPA: diaminopimelate epimerase [Terriglobales bacterium]|nr:diaminopimelate epimerase [Terriglobales bacterium]